MLPYLLHRIIGTNMERLTPAQMSEKYPNQYLGITNIKYNGATIEEADVIYTDKSDTELLRMQLLGNEGIEMWCTAKPSAYIGVIDRVWLPKQI